MPSAPETVRKRIGGAGVALNAVDGHKLRLSGGHGRIRPNCSCGWHGRGGKKHDAERQWHEHVKSEKRRAARHLRDDIVRVATKPEAPKELAEQLREGVVRAEPIPDVLQGEAIRNPAVWEVAVDKAVEEAYPVYRCADAHCNVVVARGRTHCEKHSITITKTKEVKQMVKTQAKPSPEVAAQVERERTIVKRSTGVSRVTLLYLRGIPGKLVTAEEVAKETGLSVEQTKNALSYLRSKEVIRSAHRGVYEYPDNGAHHVRIDVNGGEQVHQSLVASPAEPRERRKASAPVEVDRRARPETSVEQPPVQAPSPVVASVSRPLWEQIEVLADGTLVLLSEDKARIVYGKPSV